MTYLILGSSPPARAARVGSLLLGCGLLACAQQYTITTIAGGVPPAAPSPANVSIANPARVTTDSAGNFYFSSLSSVFKLDSSGVLTVVAGNSRAGFSGDGGLAIQAQLNNPQGIAVDAAGDLFIADTGNNRVREVTPDGKIQTIAGIGVAGFYGDLGPATQAMLNAPAGVAVDSAGNVYIADSGNNAIRKVLTSGIITIIAGNSYAGGCAPPATTPSPCGDGGPATGANLYDPQDVALGPNGSVYIVDTGNASVRRVEPNGIIHTVAGSASQGYAGDGGPANSAVLTTPYAVAVDGPGNYYIADLGNNDIRMVNTKGIISTIAGTQVPGFSGDGGPAISAKLNQPSGVAVDASGNLYVADEWNLRIRKIASGNITTVAGNGLFSYSGDGGPAAQAELYNPQGVAVDSAGNIYVADTRNAVVRKIAGDGTISTLAGTSLKDPRGLATDTAGNLYVSDFHGNVVKKIAPDGTVTTVAGNGSPGFGGDGGAATSAQLNGPFGLAVDASGNLYISDFANNRIRQVSPTGGITTVAGTGAQSYFGDGGPATQAGLNGPLGVAVDAAGNLYIADTNDNVIREVTGGNIRTIAGTGVPGTAGDGGPPTRAQIIAPSAIALDASGNIYITDGALRVRKIYPGYIIGTIAGDGAIGYSGDNGLATQASLNSPDGLAVDASGNIYIGDAGNNAVRKLQPAASGMSLQAVTNAASNLPGPVAPGEVVVLWGSGLGPAQLFINQIVANGALTNTAAGATVFFNGVAAPLVYTSSAQTAAVVPFGVTGPSVQVVVSYQGQLSAPLSVPVAATAPALFTLNYSGKGQAAALNQNDSVNAAASPAAAGSQVTLFATGLGQTSPPGTDGLITTAAPPTPVAAPIVTIGGQAATVVSATGIPGAVAGVMMIVVQVPSGVTPGNAVPVTLEAAGVSAPAGITIAVSP